MPLLQTLKYFWDGDWLPDELPLWPAQPIVAPASPIVQTTTPQQRLNAGLQSKGYAAPATPVIQTSSGKRTSTTPVFKTSSGKRPASPRASESPLARKKIKTFNGKAVKLGVLRKKSGKSVTTRKTIIPEGVLAGRVSKRFPPTLISKSSKGFSNPRNKCFSNAALQALLHAPAIYHLLGNIHRDCDKSLRQCVTCALQDLAQRYWSLESPRGARKTLDYPELDTAILRDIPKTPITANGTFHDLVGWHYGEQDDPSLYVRELERHITAACDDDEIQLFHKVLRMTRQALWTCSACGEQHRSSEQSGSFIVPLNTPEDLADKTLANLIHYNLFTEQVRLRCETEACQVSRAVALIPDDADMPFETRNYFITEAPECLIVVQKRFAQKVDKNGKNLFYRDERGNKVPASTKWYAETHYEEYLNLGRYTKDDSELFYRLDAVIGHSGRSVDGGHYITVAREANGVDFAVINDATVAVGNNVQLMETIFWGETEFEPYMMFYSKV